MQVKIVPNPEKPGYFTVFPTGPIDSDTYQQFRDKVTPILNDSTRGVILDMSNVDYISSAGLGILFTIKKHLKQKSGELVFCHLKPQIQRLFEIVNALPQETMFKDHAEADAYLYRMMNKTAQTPPEK